VQKLVDILNVPQKTAYMHHQDNDEPSEFVKQLMRRITADAALPEIGTTMPDYLDYQQNEATLERLR
jgi:hypothetical protein